MGRPPTRPSRLRDGFYIEVRTKGSNSAIKLNELAPKVLILFYLLHATK
jgi:hypothetical protein